MLINFDGFIMRLNNYSVPRYVFIILYLVKIIYGFNFPLYLFLVVLTANSKYLITFKGTEVLFDKIQGFTLEFPYPSRTIQGEILDYSRDRQYGHLYNMKSLLGVTMLFLFYFPMKSLPYKKEAPS